MKISKSGFILIFGIFLVILLFTNFSSVDAETQNIGIRGDTVTISAILLQNGTYGIPVPDQIIEFYDQKMNTFLNFEVTNDDGYASIQWVIPNDYPLGPTIVNATYRGNESLFLAPSCQWVTINILSSTTLMVNYDTDTLAPNDFFSFDVQILDDSSSPLHDATISVYSNNILLATKLTNDSGIVSFSIHCNSSWSVLGENIIHVVFEQDLENCYSRADKIFTIQIHKLDTELNIDSLIDQTILGDQLSAAINLNCTEGGLLGNLEISLDGTYLETASTDSQGSCVINLDIDNRFSLGSHILQIYYAGNDRYLEAIIFKEFDVFGYVNIECKADVPMILGSVTEFNINVKDVFSRSISGILDLSDQTSGYNISIKIPTNLTSLRIPFTILNPVGLHNISIELRNSFVLNGSLSSSLTVWSLPKIELLETNIFHYASPDQEFTFLVHLTDFIGNSSHKDVQLLLEGSIIQSFLSDENGCITIVVRAPFTEGIYNYSLYCPENSNLFELPSRLDYQLTVNKQIPTIMHLVHYEIISPLQMIKIKLQVLCLNGSLLEGISTKFDWLSIEKHVMTKTNGEINLQLPLPTTNGNFLLYYEINSTDHIASSSGTINIYITYDSILASQGIGISGFLVTFTAISILFAIPILRQRFLI